MTLFVLAKPAFSQDQAEELAQQLANPVAALISVPFQINYDSNIGPADDGTRTAVNVQPVLPFELDDQWNLISRTILPVIDQKDVFPVPVVRTGLAIRYKHSSSLPAPVRVA